MEGASRMGSKFPFVVPCLVVLIAGAVCVAGLTDPGPPYTTPFPTPQYTYAPSTGICTWQWSHVPSTPNDQTDPADHNVCEPSWLGLVQEKYAHARAEGCYTWGYAWAKDQCTGNRRGAKSVTSGPGSFTLTRVAPLTCNVTMYCTFHPSVNVKVCNTGVSSNGWARSTQNARVTELPSQLPSIQLYANETRSSNNCTPFKNQARAISPPNVTVGPHPSQTVELSATADVAAYADAYPPGVTDTSECWIWGATAGIILQGICPHPCSGNATVSH